MTELSLNPAEQAAHDADVRLYTCIDTNQSFRLEAGAGAGKTHSLVLALRHLIDTRGDELLRHHQRVACITYTNVAKEEIEARTDRHPVVFCSTIHSFCWGLIKDFQPQLRAHLPSLTNWSERIAEIGGLRSIPIVYNLGYPKASLEEILLGHNDVLQLAAHLFEQPKFRRLVTDRFPVLFIDEYQDTDKAFAEALKTHLMQPGQGPLVGLFGDSWQKIYGTGCGSFDHPALEVIGKQANFRSVPTVIDVLNRMRPDLPQQPRDPDGSGFVGVYHTNSWSAARRTGQHWAGDLPSADAREALERLRTELAASGWDLTPDSSKILMLTHKVLAEEQGYSALANVFSHNESFLKKEDPHIGFFADTLEPLCRAYQNRRFGEMFAVLGERESGVRTHADKEAWAAEMNTLLELRSHGTIGEVVDFLKTARPLTLPDSLRRLDNERIQNDATPPEEEPSSVARLRAMRPLPYQEVVALTDFVEGYTPFDTKHGVKGAEFENVIVVLGRGWNLYDFNQFLAWAPNPPAAKRDAYERNRNLFYVVCSRSKRRLALLFTQELSAQAITTLSGWFGASAMHALSQTYYVGQ
jgi:DNA helicase-2/ATP-dependent DNA helicase PcrA